MLFITNKWFWNCYVTVTWKDVRSIGFIAHMDTADFNAVNVSPQIVENYDGESTIPLDKKANSL